MAVPAAAEMEDYNNLAKEGMTLMIKNDWKAAEELFKKHKDSSVQMCAGSSFVCVLQGLMSFEEEKLEEAMTSLHNTISRCKHHPSKHSRRSSSASSGSQSEAAALCERIRNEIIATDCHLFQAGLIIVKQDLSSYIKGGWYIRQAWKSYKKLYYEIRGLHTEMCSKQCSGDSVDPDHDEVIDVKVSSTDPVDLVEERLASSITSEYESQISPTSNQGNLSPISSKSSLRRSHSASSSSDMESSRRSSAAEYPTHGVIVDQSVKEQLLAAVCFGYGSFKLMISLCPPKILKLIEFLGMEGDQQEGLACLELTVRYESMMAPLALLSLVWYHTVIRPFFSLDGSNMTAGITEATRLLEIADKDYPDSALFYYFRGRILVLKGQIEDSMKLFQETLAMACSQRETEQICLYEIGRLSMLMMNWEEGLKCFLRLKEESRWSRSFHAYNAAERTCLPTNMFFFDDILEDMKFATISAFSSGSMNDMERCRELMTQVPSLVRNKNSPLEMFVIRRVGVLNKQTITQQDCLLLSAEMLYIWTLDQLSSTHLLQNVLQVCGKESSKTMPALQCFVNGVINKRLNNGPVAEQNLLKVIEYYDNDRSGSVDKHWAAFACFEMAALKSVENHFKNYDFEQRLSVKVNHALKRISDHEQHQQHNKSCLIQ